MSLFQLGDYTLHSGSQTDWKIDCDALDGGDWRALARIARAIVKPYTDVQSIPRGGDMLALYLRAEGPPVTLAGRSAREQHWLIVDDVCTSGGSFKQAHAELRELGVPAKQIEGVCVFARGPYPAWVKPIFRLHGVA